MRGQVGNQTPIDDFTSDKTRVRTTNSNGPVDAPNAHLSLAGTELRFAQKFLTQLAVGWVQLIFQCYADDRFAGYIQQLSARLWLQ